MSDWSHGYNVSLGYTYGFYREMAPDWLDMCARMAGFVAPNRGEDGAFRYLELGSGQGFGLCLLAAANPDGEFVGVDFNPEHIAHSEELAAAGGLTNIRFIEGDFSELGARWPADLGQFDYAAMHGICSWVPATVRDGLVACLDKALKPGALVYNSYNSKPGWISTQPFQHIARRMQIVGGLSGPKALDETVALFDQLMETNSAIKRALPTLKMRLDSVRTQNRAYLVQEYLHENWSLFWFSQMMDEMSVAKLSFIGSATIAEQMLPGFLPAALRAPIEAQTDPILRQEVLDCAINQSFRRDIMCRGARTSFGRRLDSISGTIIHLIGAPKGDEVKVSTSFGEIKISRENFAPIIEALSDGPATIGDVLAKPVMSGKPVNPIVQNMMLLAHTGILGTGRSKPCDPAVAQRFNRIVARAVAEGAPYTQLAIPALGSGIPINDVEAVLLSTYLATPTTDFRTLVQPLLTRLAAVGKSFSKDGKALEGEARDKRAEGVAKDFVESTLPRLRRMGAIA